MTTRDRRALAEAFKEARKRIESRRCHYICYALKGALDERKIDCWAAQSAGNLILDRLSPYNTVEGWLMGSAGVPVRFAQNAELSREYRLRWLDSLIEEFS